jgi:hypothetical protein
METVTISLVSHTNVGKTTLARTLLRRDIGEVLDQAHVTEVSEAHELIATSDQRLMLWDTPGFGDTVRLLKRLRGEKNPIGWFLHQVWDRITDRPLWCGQEAARNVQQDADVVLYLVAATEDPETAGYIGLEMELLRWLEKPVIMLLNQTGVEGVDEPAEARWRQAAKDWPVAAVLTLDAFTRCWVQEGVLLERVGRVLPAERRDAMASLRSAWNERNLEIFGECCDVVARYLAAATADAETMSGPSAGKAERKRAMERLADRLRAATDDMMERLVTLHGLDRTEAARLVELLERDYDLPAVPVDTKTSALWGGLVTGAMGGLAADVLAGGLTFGGGAVAGAILGALGAAGLAQAYQLVGGDDATVRWSRDFLASLRRDALRRYLAVAHFGRGRGEWRESDRPDRWPEPVERALAEWPVPIEVDDLGSHRPAIETALRGVLIEAYPDAASWFV